MNASTSSRLPRTSKYGLTGRPHFSSRAYVWDWLSVSSPSRAPMPWTNIRSGRLAVSAGSFCRSEPAAAFLGLASGALPASISASLNSAKALDGMKTSPRISISGGKPLPVSSCGISLMVSTLWVMSSPVVPSPRVAARTSLPSRYSRLTARPSILSSVSHAGRAVSPSLVTPASALVIQASSSSREKTSSRLYIRCRCSTAANAAETSPPTSCVGESLATSSGCSASISSRRRNSSSNSASDTRGSSSW